MTINCKFCRRTYKTKFNYITHLKTNHLEDGIIEKHLIFNEISYVHSNNVGKVLCDHCQKPYSSEYALLRHKKNSCKVINKSIEPVIEPKNISDYKLILSVLEDINTCEITRDIDEKYLLKIQTHVEKLLRMGKDEQSKIVKANDISNLIQGDHAMINHNTNNTQNINIVLKISDLGKEKEHILEDIYFANDFFNFLSENLVEDKRRYGGGWRIDQSILHKALVRIFKYVHCNSDFPENHNIYVSNKKYWIPFKVYKEGEWVLGSDVDLKDAVISNQDRFIRLIDILIENNPEEAKTLNNIKEAFGYEKDVKHDLIARDFFRESYNHKKIIEESYKQNMNLDF